MNAVGFLELSLSRANMGIEIVHANTVAFCDGRRTGIAEHNRVTANKIAEALAAKEFWIAYVYVNRRGTRPDQVSPRQFQAIHDQFQIALVDFDRCFSIVDTKIKMDDVPWPLPKVDFQFLQPVRA